MSAPLVSIVLPVYNGEKFVAEALESILEQSHKPIEIIGVNDGSTDNSVEVIKRYPEVLLISQENGGAASARNKGMAYCKGEYVAFLDHDDRWEPDKVQIQVSYLESHPDAGFVLGTQRIFLEPGAELPDGVPRKNIGERTVAAGTGTTMIRRSVFEKVGPFNTDFINGEDTEWFVRAIELGYGFGVAEDATIQRRYHGGNATYDVAEMRKSLLKILHASVVRKREKERSG